MKKRKKPFFSCLRYKGRHQAPAKGVKPRLNRAFIILILALTVFTAASGASYAYIRAQSGAVVNLFEQAITYRLHYDVNTGTGDIGSQEYVTSLSEASHAFSVTYAEPEKEDYLFLGWAESPDATEAQYGAGEIIYLECTEPEKTLYAVWEKDASQYKDFLLVFDTNIPQDIVDAQVAVPETIVRSGMGTELDVNLSYPVISDTNVDNTGLRFLGWDTTRYPETPAFPVENAGDGIAITLTRTEANNVEYNMTTLYAIWAVDYYVEYHRNAPDDSVEKIMPGDDSYVDDLLPISYVTDYPVISALVDYESTEYRYVRPEHMLIGFADTEGSADIVQSASIEKPGKNNALKLYAVWKTGSFALIYDANGGNYAPDADIYNGGEESHDFTVTSTLPTYPAATEARFLGWANHPEDTVPAYKVGDIISLKEDAPTKTVYAVWEYTYRLNFNKGHATGGQVPAELVFTTTDRSHIFAIPKDPKPARSGYNFGYWAPAETRVNGEARYYDEANYNRTILLRADRTSVTLYARMQPTEGVSLHYMYTVDGVTYELWQSQGPILDNTQDFTYYSIMAGMPDEYPENKVLSGWADLDHRDEILPQYNAGDMIVLDGDVSAVHEIYAVWKSWDQAVAILNTNGGTYNSCNSTSSEPIEGTKKFVTPVNFNNDELDEAQLEITTLTALNIKKDDHDLLGLAYDNNGGTRVDVAKSEEDGEDASGCSNARIEGIVFEYEKYLLGTSTQDVIVTENEDGSKLYTLNLYAVWAERNATDAYVLKINPNYSDSSENLFGTNNWKNLEQTSGQDGVTFAKDVINSAVTEPTRTDYTLLGYAETADATVPEYSVASNGTLTDDVLVSQKGKNIVITEDASDYGEGTRTGNTYTLTLYAVWQPSQYYRLELYDGTTLRSTSQQKDASGVLQSYNFSNISLTASYWNPTGRQLLGFAYSPDATSPDFPVNNQRLSAVAVSRDSEHIQVSQNSNGVNIYTQKLYAVWSAKQIFRVDAYDGSSYMGRASSPEMELTETSYSFSSISISENKLGYKLIGYSDSPDSDTVVYPVSGTRVQGPIVVDETATDVVTSTDSNGVTISTKKIYAIWEKLQVFEILLDYNGGKYGSASSETDATERPLGDTAYTFSSLSGRKPTRTGYEFVGYAHSPDATVADYTISGYTPSPYILVDKQDDAVTSSMRGEIEYSTLKLYAVWKEQQNFVLKINANGGTMSSSRTTQTKTVDIEESSCTWNAGSAYFGKPTRTGYSLLGYSFDPNATSPDFTQNSSGYIVQAVTISENDPHVVNNTSSKPNSTTATLYAVWQQKQMFILQTDANGGRYSSAAPSKSVTVDSTETTASWAAGTLKFDLPERPGFALRGYSFDPNATVPEFTLNDKGYIEQTVSFMDTDGDVITGSSGGMITSTKKLYAIWAAEKTYQVKFNLNGGGYYDETGALQRSVLFSSAEQPMDSTSYTFEAPSYSSSKNSQPTRNGYVFCGYTDVEGSTQPVLQNPAVSGTNPYDFTFTDLTVTDDEAGVTTTIEADGTVNVTKNYYAIWAIELSYVNADGAPGKEVRFDESGTVERTFAVTDYVPENKNFIFAGWADSTNRNKPKYGIDGYETGNLGTVLATEITIGANTGSLEINPVWWQKYTLEFTANGGIEDSTPELDSAYVTLGYGAETTSMYFSLDDTIPEREGYTFLGWAKSADATEGKYQPGEMIYVEGNADGSLTKTKLYAIWEKNEEDSNEPEAAAAVDDEESDQSSGGEAKLPSTDNTGGLQDTKVEDPAEIEAPDDDEGAQV